MRSIRCRLFGEISLATAIAAALGLAATAAAAASAATATLDTQPATATADGDGASFSGGSGDSSPVISFIATDFYDYNPSQFDDSVFIANASDPSKSFRFNVSSTSYTVTDAQLWNSVKGSVIAKASLNATTGQGVNVAPVIITCTLPSYSLCSCPPCSLSPVFLALFPLPNKPVGVQPTGTGTQNGIVTIEDTGRLFDNELEGIALFLQITWSQAGGVRGSSYSRNFTYVDPNTVLNTILPFYTNTNPILPETRIGGSSQTTGATRTTATETANPTATNADGSLGSGHSGSSSSSGLSKGAIAGIVVGAVAGIALIAALVFFLLRRRRNRDAANKAYNSALLSGSVEPYRGAGPVSDIGGPHANLHPNLHDGLGSGTAVNLMEKDAVVAGVAGRFAGGRDRDAGPDTPNSPHSPYSDEDGSAPQIIPDRPVPTSSAGASAAASPSVRTAQNVTPAVSPVAVPAQPVVPGSASGASAGAAAAAQPAIRGQVAALIEDHMTPEDVARLEAEERELDADIENAIRNRAAASSR